MWGFISRWFGGNFGIELESFRGSFGIDLELLEGHFRYVFDYFYVFSKIVPGMHFQVHSA